MPRSRSFGSAAAVLTSWLALATAKPNVLFLLTDDQVAVLNCTIWTSPLDLCSSTAQTLPSFGHSGSSGQLCEAGFRGVSCVHRNQGVVAAALVCHCLCGTILSADQGTRFVGKGVWRKDHVAAVLTRVRLQDITLGSLKVMPKLQKLVTDQGAFFSNAFVNSASVLPPPTLPRPLLRTHRLLSLWVRVCGGLQTRVPDWSPFKVRACG